MIKRASVELTCTELPDDPDDVEIERTMETRAMWDRARKVAKRFDAKEHFAEHWEDACTYGDAYLYPPLSRLEPFLDALDRADVGYDNVDVPIDAPRSLVIRLRRRYPKGSGVWVNIMGM